MHTDQDDAETLEQRLAQQQQFWARRERDMRNAADAAAVDTRMGSEFDESAALSNAAYAKRCQRDLDEAIAALRRQPGTWQDISTAPIDQRAVLACHENNRTGTTGFQVTWRVAVDSPEYVHRGMERGATWKPTHWMPLPAAPASLKE